MPTITQFEHMLHAEGLSRNTIGAYASFLRQFLSEYGDLTQETYDRWRVDASEYSASTVRQRVAALRKWADFVGVEFDYRKLPKIRRDVPIAITEDERDRILRGLNKPTHRLAVLLMSEMGLRVSEACSVKWDDVDEDERTLVVMRKGGKRQVVPILTERLVQALREADHTTEYVLRGLDRSAIGQAVKRAAKRVGVEAHPHAFRHGFAVRAYKKNAPVAAIGTMLGHSSAHTTSRYLDGLQMGTDELRGALE